MNTINAIAEKIAGEITLSPRPGQTIRKWREMFQITQSELARFLKVSPSVICDYESARRKSPGIESVRRIVKAFIEIDEKKNDANILQRYQAYTQQDDGVLDIREYPYGIPVSDFISEIKGTILTSMNSIPKGREVNGYTLIDSIKTIKTLNSSNYVHLYGWNTERALIFTGVHYGRSPMVAIRIHPVKPSVVVYHKPHVVDPLAVTLAEHEKIPLVVTTLSIVNLRKKLGLIGVE